MTLLLLVHMFEDVLVEEVCVLGQGDLIRCPSLPRRQHSLQMLCLCFP